MLSRINKSLRAKLFLLLFGLNLSVIIVVGAISYNSTRIALTEQLEDNLSIISSQLAQNVDRYIAERMSDTGAIALHYALFNLKTTTSNQNDVLARYLKIYPYYEQISIINVEDIKPPDSSTVPGSRDPWYLPALQGHMVSSDMFISELTDKPTMSFAAPVKDESGRIVSIVTTNLKLEYLWNIIDHIKNESGGSGTSGYAFMVNRNGVVIADPDHSKILSENLYLSGDHAMTETVQDMTLGRSGTSSYTYKGEKKFVAFSPCTGFGEYEGHGWSVAVSYPYSEIFMPLKVLLSKYLFIFLLTSLAAVFVSNQLANYLVRPIFSLKEGATKIGSGDFGMRIVPDTTDELGELAGSFNDMAATLQTRDEQITEYTRTLTAINNELNLKQEELARANNVLKHTNEELKKLEEHKAEFTEMLTHDIKSPLSTIITYTDMMLSDTITGDREQIKKAGSSINASAYKILSLVDNFLASSAIEAGRLHYNMRLLDINEFIQDEIQFFLPRMEKKNIQFAVDRNEELPNVMADKVQLDRALTNLLTNALKYTSSGGSITLSTGTEDKWVYISVSDTGRGIPKEDMEDLFKKFKRSKTAGKVEGLGLGLFITKSIIEGHNGHITVQSAPGEGSTFTIYLPAARS
jgi:signal transduction histidine kinase